MVQRLGRVAGESQRFTNPITGKNCKTCVLTRKRNANNDRVRVHRFRSYPIGNPDMQGSFEERNCLTWQLAWIAISERWGDEKIEGDSPEIILGNDHGYSYAAIRRGDCDIDREAYDEVVHTFKSLDDSCFVSIESLRKQKFSDRHPVDSALLQTFELFVIGPDDTRPGLPEMNLPESATFHNLGYQHPSQIESWMWDSWYQVLNEAMRSTHELPNHAHRIVECASRLSQAPRSDIGMC